ncbi:MAG: aminoacyl-tRNA hydrolase [Patescibacteria group bacterium]|nr:aminoacyl-tRNA hydrolase [Patescibacteria group bacterium]
MTKIIAGLGNPGEQYQNTRHNMGYLVLNKLAESLGENFSRDNDLDAQILETNLDGEKLILIKPETFMNKSGEAIKKAASKFKLEDAAQIWVVYDDAMLPFGVLRIRLEGSAGGHNGVKSLIENLGEEDFVRLRVGIGEPVEPMVLEDWVLAKFGKDEKDALPEIIETVVKKIQYALNHGIESVTENLTE